jgi:hypothetical protein
MYGINLKTMIIQKKNHEPLSCIEEALGNIYEKHIHKNNINKLFLH